MRLLLPSDDARDKNVGQACFETFLFVSEVSPCRSVTITPERLSHFSQVNSNIFVSSVACDDQRMSKKRGARER